MPLADTPASGSTPAASDDPLSPRGDQAADAPDEPAQPPSATPAAHAAGASIAGTTRAAVPDSPTAVARVILLLETDDVAPPAVGWIEPRLESALDLLDLPESHRNDHRVTLALFDDDAMARLHADHTGVPGTTDVLTFDHRPIQPETGEPQNDLPLDADIALGRDVAIREAAGRPHDARTELLLYAVHGLLHLVGHDDHDPDRYAAMHAAEDDLLQQLGLPRAFSSNPSGGHAQ